MRRILLISVFCLLFVTGCSSVPLRLAEKYSASIYKRIPYETEDGYRVMDIFYATTRRFEDANDLPSSFLPELAGELSYGTVATGVKPGLTIGKMLPILYEKKRFIGLRDVRKMESDIFLKKLSDAVRTSTHKSLLVLVFGYEDSFEYRAIKAAYFAYLLDVNTPVLMFDWPSDQPLSVQGYLDAERLAEDSGVYLGDLLAKIIREVKPKKFWIQASSLGSQVVCKGFEQMYLYDDLADADHEIDHVILAAPDVSEDEFNERFRDEITALSKKLTAYVSSNDEALLFSGMINKDDRLGRQDARAEEPEQLEEAKDLLYLKSLDPDRVSLVDVTPINKASYKHGYYLESPEFFDDFYLRILDEPPHVNRRLYLLRVKDNIDYWVLRGD